MNPPWFIVAGGNERVKAERGGRLMRGIASFCGKVSDFKLYLLAMRVWIMWSREERRQKVYAH